MTFSKLRQALLGFGVATLALPLLAAAPFADPAAIDMAVAAFTGAEAGAPGGATVPADRRLRLMLHWDVNNGVARRAWAS